MKRIYFLLFYFSFYLSGFADTPDFSMVGFAKYNRTTGGNTAGADKIIDVSSAAELIDAIGTKKEGGLEPRIIRVNGTIDNGGTEIDIKECENITIFGADENAFISKTPIIITNSSNIIIRNIKFSMVGKSGGKDIIEITTTGSGDKISRNIWIDHCEFFNETPTAAGAESSSIKDKYDGMIDIKKYSEYITVSWCYFHDHYKGILVGFSTDKDPEDRKITMHHNRFVRINSRMPSYRAGTGHIYNNYIEGWIENGVRYGNAVHARDATNLLVENNYFTNLNRAVYWDQADSPTEGFAYGTGNIYENVTHEMTTRAHELPFVPPYEVDQDVASVLPDLLEQYAGVGIITSYDDYGGGASENKAPGVTITSPEANDVFDAPASVTVAATATDEDGSISKVEFYINGTLSETLTQAPYSFEFTGLTVGAYTFTVRAYDDKDKFTSRPVTITVAAPLIPEGESLFGPTASEDDYFWFGENTDVINSMMNDGTFSGSATFNPTADPQIDNASVTTHTGAMVIPKDDGDIIFSLPSCTVFKLYLTRTGGFSGNIFVSTDVSAWGDAVATISGSKGIQEVDFTKYATSAEAIFVRIVNTATGGLNIHGANIRLAGETSGCINVDYTKELVSTKYYSLSGMETSNLMPTTIYIEVKTFDDGSIERNKVFYRDRIK